MSRAERKQSSRWHEGNARATRTRHATLIDGWFIRFRHAYDFVVGASAAGGPGHGRRLSETKPWKRKRPTTPSAPRAKPVTVAWRLSEKRAAKRDAMRLAGVSSGRQWRILRKRTRPEVAQ